MKFKIGDDAIALESYNQWGIKIVQGRTYRVVDIFPPNNTIRLEGLAVPWWNESRFELAKQLKPHKHASLIKAWADGYKIQVRGMVHGRDWGPWRDIPYPTWYPASTSEYRIKPEPTPDVEEEFQLSISVAQGIQCASLENSNVIATFDGETGKLKAVQILS